MCTVGGLGSIITAPASRERALVVLPEGDPAVAALPNAGRLGNGIRDAFAITQEAYRVVHCVAVADASGGKPTRWLRDELTAECDTPKHRRVLYLAYAVLAGVGALKSGGTATCVSHMVQFQPAAGNQWRNTDA